MIAPQKTENESERIKALQSYQVLDSLPEREYDDITLIASQICDVPITLISLIDEDRQWFKSKLGISAEETHRDISFCGHAILNPEQPLIIEDATKDDRFVDNPLVTGSPNIAFYAGIPLVDHDGFALGTLCAIDASPRKLSAQQIESLKALGRQVVQLLELRRSKIELEEKNEYLNRFTSIAAHDIKAPIHNIYFLSQLLIEDTKDIVSANDTDLLEKIQFSAEKMTHLINGLLEYSRDHNQPEKHFKSILLTELESELKSMLLFDKTCSIEFTATLSEIQSHPILLTQVLTNLVSNAIKYNDKENPSVSLRFSETESNYLIDVKDNGPGIPVEQFEKIFEPFVIQAAKDRFGNKGHGLGLATVKKAIASLGGTIRVSSIAQEGTTFHIALPKR